MSAHKSSIKYVTVVMSKSTLYYVSFRLLCFATVQLLLIFNFLGEKFLHFTQHNAYILLAYFFCVFFSI